MSRNLKIESLVLKNFTKFEDLSIEFSQKINVIIGENGTGKTHLLKTIYAVQAALENRALGSQVKELDKSTKGGTSSVAALKLLSEAVTEKLIRVFSPADGKIGKLRYFNAGVNKAEVLFNLANGEKYSFEIGRNSQRATVGENLHYSVGVGETPVFIPTKEILSLVAGIKRLGQDQSTLKLLFDDVYLDLAHQIMQEPRSAIPIDEDPRFGAAYIKLVDVLGGHFEWIGTGGEESLSFSAGRYKEARDKVQHALNTRVTTRFEKSKNEDISAHMTAEGFRKLGMLQCLMANGQLDPRVCSVLLWDEPETNMNPKMMKLLVELLLELSRNNQQIIIATHDYVLLKWFDLLMNVGAGDNVRFHSLYRDDQTKQIHVKSTNNYLDIDPNPIDDAFASLADREIAKEMGNLGR